MSKKLKLLSSSKKTLVTLNILSLLLFIFILYGVLNHTAITLIDSWVNTHIASVQTPDLTEVFITITNFNGVMGNMIFAFFAILFLTYKKWYADRLFYLLSFGGSLILFLSIKLMVARPRPHSDLIDVINYSFPSGHSTLTMTTALLVYFIIVERLSSKLAKNIFLLICIVWPVFIALSRVYLNVHWLSDTIAGLALGVFWVTFIRLLLLKLNSR